MSARGETHPSTQASTPEGNTKAVGKQAIRGESHCTDLANGQRFARQHAGRAKFVPAWRAWMTWDGQRWALDDVKAVSEMAKTTARRIYAEAAKCESEKAAEGLAKWAVRSADDNGMRHMLSVASSDPRIVARPNAFDQDAYRLNTPGGEVDLRTGAIEPNNPAHLCSKMTTVAMTPGAPAPRWSAFLQEIFGGDAELIGYVQRLLGYSLLGTVREHVFILAWGGGANGKSVLLDTISRVLGSYAGVVDPSLLLVKRNDAHPVGIADLQGLRFVAAQETAQGRALDEAMVKNLASGGTRKARWMHGNFFEYDASDTIWLATNHLPVIRNTDMGIWRRIRLIPFRVTISPDRQDPELTNTLATGEGPAILAWLVDGCLAYLREGLGEAQAVAAATATYRAESDILGQFMAECCVVDANATVPAREVFEEYAAWGARGHLRVLNQNAFAREMEERGIEKTRTKHGVSYRGLGLRVAYGSPLAEAGESGADPMGELPDATQRRHLSVAA